MKKLISLIVPVYKKEDIIKKCLTDQLTVLNKVCTDFDLDYEIIPVIDGFLDNSEEKINELLDPHIKIISYKHNRGKGFAVRLGMMQSSGNYVGYMDACLDINPIVIEYMIRALINNPDVHIVVPSKKHPASKLIYPLQRRIFTTVYSLVCKLFTGIKYKDTQVGAKMYTKELIDKVLPRMLVKRFAFEVEMLSVAGRLGYKNHIDVPVEVDFTIDWSSATNIKTIINMFRDTIAVGYRLRILRYYDDSNHKKWGDSLHDLLNKRVIRML